MENVKFSDMVIVGNLSRGYHFTNDVKNVVTDETRSGVHFISFKHKNFLKGQCIRGQNTFEEKFT